MRAIVVRPVAAPDALVPERVPGNGQVIAPVEACGVCFPDVVTRSGTLTRNLHLAFPPARATLMAAA